MFHLKLRNIEHHLVFGTHETVQRINLCHPGKGKERSFNELIGFQ